MANYIVNKIVCTEEILNEYFLDYYPIDENESLREPYISFNKLFGVKSLNEYKEKETLKKGIYIVLSISLFMFSCLTLGKIDNDKAVNVNSTPITNKVIVVDAGHRKTR